MKKIVDISHYHPVKNWSKTKNNVEFLISKATQGTTYVDSTLDSFIRGCEKHKIPYWLYAYLNKGKEKAQAEYMVSKCRGRVGKYFVGYILDVEEGNSAANVKSALKYINSLGYKTMIYTMYANYKKYADVIADRGKNCAYWEARYGLNTGTYNPKYAPHKSADLQQFTSKGTCAGISGKVDLNRISGKKTLAWFKTPLKKAAGKPKPETSAAYYKKYTGKSAKIDTVLKAIGVPKAYYGSWKKRRPIAKKNGISKYEGTAKQNMKLISLAKKGKLKKYTGKSQKK